MSDREGFRALHIDPNSTVEVDTFTVAGFAPSTAGTITIEVRGPSGTFSETPIDGIHLAVGHFMELPMVVPNAAGIRVTLGGGAGGTLFY